jgi:hypothetical protein
MKIRTFVLAAAAITVIGGSQFAGASSAHAYPGSANGGVWKTTNGGETTQTTSPGLSAGESDPTRLPAIQVYK